MTSVGIVLEADINTKKKSAASKEASADGKISTIRDHYLKQLYSFAPNISELLEEATLNEGGGDYGVLKSASDFSYSAGAYAGDHFRLIGDAAGINVCT